MTSSRAPGCVLAGGQSTRMGCDKALLQHRGSPLIEHAVVRLRAADCEPVIAGTRVDLASYAPVLSDLHPGCGPLGGIEAALESLPDGFPGGVLFLPVDLPLLPVSFLTLLLGRAERTGALATIPVLGGRPQPLCAIYRRQLLPGITAALDAGEYKVMRVLEALTTVGQRDFFTVEAVLAARGSTAEILPPHLWFANLNHPADLAALTRLTESLHATYRIH